jgi:hypothetical protein
VYPRFRKRISVFQSLLESFDGAPQLRHPFPTCSDFAFSLGVRHWRVAKITASLGVKGGGAAGVVGCLHDPAGSVIRPKVWGHV